ncbi:chromosome transmission fidelity protein 18 [Achaetomium macrosporum]|uniref:Chromosome transmission fidelity protein 18 n=1 Tax=Achaetomium macrosporum TaxID=79813 RepID=A0AAN7H4Z4_9PEZI|nr:chromosome transmission fidelity protein 18 [Achaetomium macrosporum]
MLAPSSPITFPASSSPANSKRPRPTDAPRPPKPRVLGGFLADDDSDDDETPEQPSPKRRMLRQDSQDAQVEHGTQERGSESLDETLPAAQEVISTPPDSQLHEESEEEAERYERLFGSHGSRILSSFTSGDPSPAPYHISTCSGKTVPIRERKPAATVSYATMVAARSKTKEGRAHRSYYGIAIHELIDSANKELGQARKESAAAAATAPITPPANPDRPVRSVEAQHTNLKKPRRTLLWTEKYRARTFMDLVGDDLTNRHVLRWLKRWDPIVFPHAAKTKASAGSSRRQLSHGQQPEEEKPHRKILMLHGPPGLGKTTLAHVCARQAGYEVMEINASDERSKDVVKGRIRTSLGTESVKTVENKRPEPGKQQKIARPVCVVVDEVDGVVGGSGGSGEGGFVKALIDLLLLDQKNSSGSAGGSAPGRRKKKGDDFRQMRPLILICNDVYHPSLRPLRQSGLAEVIHVGKPPVEAVVTRLKTVFEKEGIPCEKDAVRKLCEAAWGMTSGIDAKRGAESNAEGDLRGVMVVGEWVAGRLRATSKDATPCLTRQWLDRHIIHDLAHGGGGARGLGRGGVKEIVTRVFQEGAGFPKQSAPALQPDKAIRHEQPQAQLGFAEQQKKYAMSRLGEMIDTSGEIDRIMTDIFLEYPNREFNDDSFLTKPDLAYDWLHFHDTCTSRLFASQEWELAPYASQPVLACHHLFASPRRYHSQTTYGGYGGRWGDETTAADDANTPPLPFSGPRADYAAHEAEKANRAALQALHAQMPPALTRAFRSPEDIATDFLPYLVRMVSPDVKPVVVGGSSSSSDKGGGGAVASVRREGEKAMVRRAAQVLAEVGIALHRGRIEPVDDGNNGSGLVAGRTQWVYRMEPDLDALATFETAGAYVLATQAPPTRYAVRQVLDQELQKTLAQRENAARQARLKSSSLLSGRAAHADSHHYHDFDDDADKENLNLTPPTTSAADGKAQRKQQPSAVKRDFFGRVIVERPLAETDGNAAAGAGGGGGKSKRRRGEDGGGGGEGAKVWVTYHEGINNAVRKPISLEEFLRGF